MDENKSLGDANLSGENRESQPQDQAKTGTDNTASQSAQPVKNEVSQEQKPVQKPIITPNPSKTNVKKRRFHLYHIKNAIKKAHPLNIKAKLEHYRFEYSRILHLARKPTKQEFKELSIMVIVGTFIIGILGFIIQMIIQFM